VINSDVVADARAPDGGRPGAAQAAARACDSGITPGRLEAITTTNHGAMAIRCEYSLVGWPALTSEIHCVDGQWTGPLGVGSWGELGIDCVP